MPESMPQSFSCGGRSIMFLNLCRLTEQCQQAIALTEYRCHLVHHATRRANHHVFDCLTEQRYVAWSQRQC